MVPGPAIGDIRLNLAACLCAYSQVWFDNAVWCQDMGGSARAAPVLARAQVRVYVVCFECMCCVCVCVCVHVSVRVEVFVCMCVCVCFHTCACTQACLYHMHVHTVRKCARTHILANVFFFLLILFELIRVLAISDELLMHLPTHKWRSLDVHNAFELLTHYVLASTYTQVGLPGCARGHQFC